MTEKTRMGKAIGKGCGTIMCAYATGKGISFCIDLGITALVTARAGTGIEVKCAEEVDGSFGEEVIKNTLEHIGIDHHAITAFIQGDIPPARGLKSSSAVGNALILATAQAFGKDLNAREVVELNTRSAIATSVTTAGSLDDTYASLLGGIAFTDYNINSLVERRTFDRKLNVVILSRPRKEVAHLKVDRDAFTPMASLFNKMFEEKEIDKLSKTMIINGLIHARELGYDANIILDAIRAGAIGASLSGKGPAFVAICHKENMKMICEAWKKYPGEILTTIVDNEGSKVLPF